MSYSITKIIVSKWGKRVGIAPMTDGSFEFYNKKNEFLGKIVHDKRWKKLVWIQDVEMQMSKDCLDECFKLANLQLNEVTEK